MNTEKVKELKDALRLVRDVAGVLDGEAKKKVDEAVRMLVDELSNAVVEMAKSAKVDAKP